MMVPIVTLAAPVPDSAPQAAILAAMADSAAGWNAGELDRFMAVYADDAVYVTAKGLVRGKAAIAGTYAKSFTGGGNARGRLSFVQPAFRTIDATPHAVVGAVGSRPGRCRDEGRERHDDFVVRAATRGLAHRVGSQLVGRQPAAFASPFDSCSAPFSRALGSPQARVITSLLSGRSLAMPPSRST